MKKTLPLFSALAVHMTFVVSLCNLYLLFAFLQTDSMEYIELCPWMILSLLTFAVAHLFLRKERSVPQVAILGGICFVITLVIMNLYFVHVTSIIARLFAWAFFAITTSIGFNLHLNEFKEQNLFLCCELPSFGIAILLLMDFGSVFYFPTYFAICSVAVLILSFLALTKSKMESGKAVQDGKKHIAMSTVAFCFATMASLSLAFVKFASNGATKTVSVISTFLSWLVTTILHLLYAFMMWFFSLFPSPEAKEMDIVAPESNLSAAEEVIQEEMDLGILPYVIVAVIVILVVGVCLWLLHKHRKTMISTVKIKKYQRPQIERVRISFWAKILEFWKRKWKNLVFAIKVHRYRNTPKGAMLVLAQIGKKRGVEKAENESYHSYLLRLLPLCKSIDERVEPYILTLSELANANLYAPKTSKETLGKKEYQLMREVARKIK